MNQFKFKVTIEQFVTNGNAEKSIGSIVKIATVDHSIGALVVDNKECITMGSDDHGIPDIIALSEDCNECLYQMVMGKPSFDIDQCDNEQSSALTH
jgi:hypothetical protein